MDFSKEVWVFKFLHKVTFLDIFTCDFNFLKILSTSVNQAPIIFLCRKQAKVRLVNPHCSYVPCDLKRQFSFSLFCPLSSQHVCKTHTTRQDKTFDWAHKMFSELLFFGLWFRQQTSFIHRYEPTSYRITWRITI